LRPDADVASLVDRVRRHYDDGCFACGRANPIGLQLDNFRLINGTVEATFVPRPDYRGFEGVLHGGIAATALDEILAWAGILLKGVMSVTGRLEIRYRAPLPTQRPIQARGRIDTSSDRRLRASGELLVDDEPVVTAQGLYVATEDVAQLLSSHLPD
jgi:acyl-coenzyme A thioesterase PaaI-like protein